MQCFKPMFLITLQVPFLNPANSNDFANSNKYMRIDSSL
jgi:hypothetical protein